MKRYLLVVIGLLLIGILCGCQSVPKVQTVESYGVTYTVDTENKTITDGNHTYSYSVSGNETKIYYPDGSSYWEQGGKNGFFTAGWSNDYDANRYTDGSNLTTALSRVKTPSDAAPQPGRIIAAIFVLVIGLWATFAPRSLFFLRYSIWFRNEVEPSDFAITTARFSGIACIVLAILLLLTP